MQWNLRQHFMIEILIPLSELHHAVEAAMVVCDGQEILPEHLPAPLSASLPAPGHESAAALSTLEQLERAHVEAVLRATDGHRGQAARILGISERNLYRKLRQYGLPS